MDIKYCRELIRNIERFLSRNNNPLYKYAEREHSQGKQDGMLAGIFKALNLEKGSAVEIGAWDGISFSNTRSLLEKGWECGYIEADPEKYEQLKKNIEGFSAVATNKKINLEDGNTLDDVIEGFGFKDTLSLLCIDVDGIDYWLFNSLEKCKPWVVCVEYNAYVDTGTCTVMPYNEAHSWTGGFYYGASAGAFYKLAERKGYSLVGFEPGLDLFFVRNDKLSDSSLNKIGLEAVPQGVRYNIFRANDDKGRMQEV